SCRSTFSLYRKSIRRQTRQKPAGKDASGIQRICRGLLRSSHLLYIFGIKIMSETLFAFSTVPTVGIMSLGFFLGLKHATEADHLAAVSTIVTTRRNLFSSAIVGGLWGFGHTISLMAAGVFVLLLNFQISEHTERFLETCVGVMLMFLGFNVL